MVQRFFAAVEVLVPKAVSSDALPGWEKIRRVFDKAVELLVRLLRSPEKAIEIDDADLDLGAGRRHFGGLIELRFRFLELTGHEIERSEREVCLR